MKQSKQSGSTFNFSEDAPYDRKLLSELKVVHPPYHDPSHQRSYQKRLNNWDSKWENVLEFKCDKSYQELQTQGKKYLSMKRDKIANISEEFDQKFAGKSANPFTSRFKSSDGKTLLVYFGVQHPEKQDKIRHVSMTPTMEELEIFRENGTKLYENGLSKTLQYKNWIATQELMACLPQDRVDPNDRRHMFDNKNLQRSYYHYHKGPDGLGPDQGEPKGTVHIVTCWPQKGHPHDPMTPSKSHSARAGCGIAIETWYESSVEVNDFLGAIFKKEFPEEYPRFLKAHKAARWRKSDPGPYVGKVVIWKLSGSPHIDQGDPCPTATFGLGCFEGGNMEILDIGVKLAYAPGHIVIGWTSFLCHRVTDWTDRLPCGEEKSLMVNNLLSPGRVAVVSFFPCNAFDQLEGKPPGWGKRSQWGLRTIMNGELDMNESEEMDQDECEDGETD
ncbi:hypothetical protein VKT23_015167 [Stygiomarasmius scandens]|uniref:Uncharacterized protein n=1 Tax=Marasmiellus scandens TaxID=2682957 RepID=A0ABR1IKS9_9AGAR